VLFNQNFLHFHTWQLMVFKQVQAKEEIEKLVLMQEKLSNTRSKKKGGNKFTDQLQIFARTAQVRDRLQWTPEQYSSQCACLNYGFHCKDHTAVA